MTKSLSRCARRAIPGMLSLAVLGLLLSACATTVRGPSVQSGQDTRSKVVAWAKSLLGRGYESKAIVRGRTFVLDCTGTISAAWWGAGFDIQRDFSRYTGNGVKRLYESCQDWGALTESANPKPGDIIFWSNTYDRNGNGLRDDDGLTHAGLVIAVDSDGTIEYLHASVSRGVALAWCNLKHPTAAFGPGGKVWNSPMYLGSGYGKANNPPHWLSGDLYSAMADAKTVSGKIGPK